MGLVFHYCDLHRVSQPGSTGEQLLGLETRRKWVSLVAVSACGEGERAGERLEILKRALYLSKRDCLFCSLIAGWRPCYF